MSQDREIPFVAEIEKEMRQSYLYEILLSLTDSESLP